MGRKRAFGELELSILKILKDEGIVTVSDVVKLLGNDCHYTTVMTVLNRLVEKGELFREKKGRHFEYRIEEKGIQSSFSLIDRLKEKVFDGNALSMVSYLLESAEDVSDQELEELENWIQSERKGRKS